MSTNGTGESSGGEGGTDRFGATALEGVDPAGTGGEPAGGGEPFDFGFELPEGLAEDDVAIAREFFGGLQGFELHHAEPILQRYAEWQAANDEAQEAEDAKAREDALNELGRAWGADFARNLGTLRQTVEALPFADDLANARLGSGRLMFNDPQAVQWLARLITGKGASTMANRNGSGNMIPSRQALENERYEIEKLMRKDRAEYNRDTRMQERYMHILEQLEGGD